jgi:hypothetical protein
MIGTLSHVRNVLEEKTIELNRKPTISKKAIIFFFK